MDEIYNENLYNWIDNKKINNDNLKIFFEFIKVYSEFLVTINQEFKYNKTYLPSFFEDFKKVCSDVSELNSIAHIARDCINKHLENNNEINGKLKFNINDIIFFEIVISNKGNIYPSKVNLSNKFEVHDIKKDKINIWIRFYSPDGYINMSRVYDLARQKKKTGDYDIELIEDIINDFISLVKEVK